MFTATGALARLPVAMVALAIVLLVSGTTGSYAFAGVLSAAFAITAALASIATSRLADRVGQTMVLRILAVAHSLLLLLTTLAIVGSAPAAVQIAVVVAAGGTSPAVGSYVRARWSHASVRDGEPGLLRVGFAWESILDELIFTLGPLVTTALAFGVGLPIPLIVAASAVLVGAWGLSMSTGSAPPPAPAHQEQTSIFAVVRTRGLWVLIVAALGLGTLFGALDVGAVAFTQARGSGASAGVLLACFAGASMVGGIVYGARAWPGRLHRHTQASAALLALASAGFWFTDTNAGAIAVAGLTGLLVAPTLIGIFSLTQRLVRPVNLTEGLTWTNSGLAAGFAAGSALAGILVDSYGSRAGLALCLGGAVLSTGALLIGDRLITASGPLEPVDSERTHADRTHATQVSDGPLGGPTGPQAPAGVAWNDDPLPGPHPGA
jgi:predicted MFS family arabinose efflux permease